MSSDKWRLEIYRPEGGLKSPVALYEFHSLASLRITIIENRGRTFVVRAPVRVTPDDRKTLLDLRAQGFDIAIRA